MKEKKMNEKLKQVYIGNIGVDAGCCYMGDPCYFIKDDNERPKDFGKDWLDFANKLSENVTKIKFDLGHEGMGIVVHTGYGDGVYPVYAFMDENNRIMGVTIDFGMSTIVEEENEEEI